MVVLVAVVVVVVVEVEVVVVVLVVVVVAVAVTGAVCMSMFVHLSHSVNKVSCIFYLAVVVIVVAAV